MMYDYNDNYFNRYSDRESANINKLKYYYRISIEQALKIVHKQVEKYCSLK